MIDLTPLEVRQKKGDFRRSFRGYDVELVNDFLDLVADRMEELVKQQMAMTDTVASMEEELEDYRQKERALSEALMTAQKLREDARSHAEKEGELLVREARMTAESARQEASKALAREEETLRQVRARRGQLVQSFRRLLERELGELAVIEESLELEAPEDASAERGSAERASPKRGSTERKSKPAAKSGELDLAGSEAAPSEEAGAGPEAGAEQEVDPQEDWLKSFVED
jgi:DivIVA domain-containing protein